MSFVKRLSMLFFLLLAQPGVASNQADSPTRLLRSIYKNNLATQQHALNNLSDARSTFEEAITEDASNITIRMNWAMNRLMMALPDEESRSPEINQRILDEALSEFEFLIDAVEGSANLEDVETQAALKLMHYKSAIAHELKNDKLHALKHYYHALYSRSEKNAILDDYIREAIKRLLAQDDEGGGGGGGGDGDDDQDSDGDSNGEGEQSSEYSQEQQEHEFTDTDLTPEQARQITENVSARENETRARVLQQEAKEATAGHGVDDGQDIGRGQQW